MDVIDAIMVILRDIMSWNSYSNAIMDIILDVVSGLLKGLVGIGKVFMELIALLAGIAGGA